MNFLKFENTQEHQNDSNGCKMANCMHNVVLATTQHIVLKVHFISLNCDDITTIGN